MRNCIVFIILLFSLVCSNDDTRLSINVENSHLSAKVGDTVSFLISMKLPKDYHLYSNPLGAGIGSPLKIYLEDSESIEWISATQNLPQKYAPEGLEDLWTWVWKDTALVRLSGVVLSTNSDINERIIIDGLVCKEACIPANDTVNLSLKISQTQTRKTLEPLPAIIPLYGSGSNNLTFTDAQLGEVIDVSQEQISEVEEIKLEDTEDYARLYGWTFDTQEKKTEYNVWIALVLAFIAGLILNFMPCVLPVLGIKILSFSQGREGSKKDAMIHSIAFALGMIVVFLVLATLAAFAGIGWGDQFQNPIFIVVLVGLMFLFGLGMFDLFIIFVPNKVAQLDLAQKGKNSFSSNFLKGIFATLFATPCSGPFLGATLAWTLTQPVLVIYAVFFALGLGMASPYILLASSSRLSKMIPKPGVWMEDFKHILGFILFAFALYLMVGLPTNWIFPTLSMILSLSFGVVLYKRMFYVSNKIIVVLILLLVAIVGLYISFSKMVKTNYNEKLQIQESISEWVPFTPERFDSAKAEGANIIIDFTASWCLNCQFNKINVYQTKEVLGLIQDKNIVAMKADFTKANPQAEALRTALGSRSIPFLAIFDARNYDQPFVMRDLVSKKDVIAHLKNLK